MFIFYRQVRSEWAEVVSFVQHRKAESLHDRTHPAVIQAFPCITASQDAAHTRCNHVPREILLFQKIISSTFKKLAHDLRAGFATDSNDRHVRRNAVILVGNEARSLWSGGNRG